MRRARCKSLVDPDQPRRLAIAVVLSLESEHGDRIDFERLNPKGGEVRPRWSGGVDDQLAGGESRSDSTVVVASTFRDGDLLETVLHPSTEMLRPWRVRFATS